MNSGFFSYEISPYSGSRLSQRYEHTNPNVHTHLDTGGVTAGTGAKSQVPGPIFHDRQHLYDGGILDNPLLHLHRHSHFNELKINRIGRTAAHVFRDCDICHRGNRRGKLRKIRIYLRKEGNNVE